MFKHCTKVKLESKSCPGVTIGLRKLNLGRRAAMDLSISKELAEYYAIFAEHKQVTGDHPEANKARGEINARASAFESEKIKPVVLKACVESVEGLEIDGEVADVDAMIERGPVDLADEVYVFINSGFRMTGEEEKN